MKYQFIVSYTPTFGGLSTQRTCYPLYGNDLSVAIDRESDEWYYKRKLDGKLTFIGEDYNWLMAQAFDGTFKLEINENHGGSAWYKYFDAVFSRANLEIDEDNRTASLSSFIEGVYDAIDNGKDEEYDLVRIIPEAELKEVQGQVPPALVLVDYRSENITFSDMFCGSAMVAGGYDSRHPDSGFSEDEVVTDDVGSKFMGIYVEAKVEMKPAYAAAAGIYTGKFTYRRYIGLSGNEYLIPGGNMDSNTGYRLSFLPFPNEDDFNNYYFSLRIAPSANPNQPIVDYVSPQPIEEPLQSPRSLVISGDSYTTFDSVEFTFHYIRAGILTKEGGTADNVLDTGAYFKRIAPFTGSGLTIYTSYNTSEQPNGHRLIPGTGEQGATPKYFAPPAGVTNCHPLAEENWNYGSLWYTFTPAAAFGTVGSWRWTQCWTLGTVLRYLLDRITNGKVVFTEDTTSSRFLYSDSNPVAGNEPFDYLVTQKSNIMQPGGGNASRCIVRLQWFLALLRNAFNCYYWLEPRNDGKYTFRVEHVEYFRKGGRYEGDIDHSIDLTTLKPRRNFTRGNALVKTYADNTNKYTYQMNGMVEKYTFSWQGDGGSDAFKGNPMFFKAGWIEKNAVEDHQVDNIFVDLNWLMLNAGSEVQSSQNYDGVFLFSGYRPSGVELSENGHPASAYLTLAEGNSINVEYSIWLTMPLNQTVSVFLSPSGEQIGTWTGTGSPQLIKVKINRIFNQAMALRISFGTGYANVVVHRIHAHSGQVYMVPNTINLLDNTNYLQNGPMAWPSLQNEYLHYDIPAGRWSFDSDDINEATFTNTGTVKMVQRQSVNPVPIAEKNTEDSIMSITGIRTGIEGGKTGIITNAKVNLSSRNAELTIVYNPIPEV